jgi:hypothetical protein
MSNDRQNCAICLSPVESGEDKTICPECHATYHAECWKENGGCAVYGCAQVPATEKRSAIEMPVSYWGQENKKCPNCGQEILAAAVRCRHCGTVFESARPQALEEYQQRTALSQRLPAVRRTIILLFILSVLTCSSPVGAVWGLVWYPGHREEIRSLPALYGAMCKIGLVVAIGQTVALVLFTLLFTLVRH